MSAETFDQWCIVELFGHSRIAGRVTEQTIGGTAFVRVDVPDTGKNKGFTKFLGSGAIYAMTPVDEQTARIAAEAFNAPPPIKQWDLSHLNLPQLMAGNGKPAPHPEREDWDSSYEWPDDDADGEDKDLPQPGTPEDAGQPTMAAMEKTIEQDDKLAAAQWARDLLAAGDFIIFDTETTGFDTHDEIIQIAVIDPNGDVLLDQLIKPEQPILNSQYHGITGDMVKDAPAFPAVYDRIKAALGGKPVIAYNFEYDSRMVNQVCRKHKLPEWGLEGECVMEMYAQFNGEWNDFHGNYRWKKLREALAAFGLKHEDFGAKEHDAATDARATLAVIRKMAEYQPEAAS